MTGAGVGAEVFGIREILMGVFAMVWAAVMLIVALAHQGDVPAQLWTILGIGEGTIMALFRTETYVGTRRANRPRTPVEPRTESEE